MAIHCLNQNELEKTPPLAICTPRPLRSPPGFALGQSLEPRGANCLRGRIFQYIPPFGSVLLQYTPTLEKIMSIHCLHSGWIGKYTPPPPPPPGPQDLPQQGFCTPRPLRLPSGCKIPASANLLILGGGCMHASLLSAVYCYSIFLCQQIFGAKRLPLFPSLKPARLSCRPCFPFGNNLIAINWLIN